MVAKRRPIEVSPDSELARLLDDPAGLPLELIKDGVRYELVRKKEFENYDPESARKTVRESAEAWAEIDVDTLIEHLYRAREEGSRPIERPTPLDVD